MFRSFFGLPANKKAGSEQVQSPAGQAESLAEGNSPGWLRPTPSASAPVPEESRWIGPYEIHSILGRGTMGVVYRAYDARFDRWLALKVLPVESQLDEERTCRFRREIEISVRLKHPNLVEAYFGGEIDGQLCLAMEWVEGLSLEEILAQGPLPLADFPILASQAAAGLHAAHKVQTLHRDIKPANLVVARDGHLKLLDFGLAIGDEHDRFTHAGFTMGTPAYIAPESLTEGICDEFTDQYALGVVFYTMLAGRCPFQAKDPIQLARMQIRDAPPRPRQFRSGIPEAWEETVLRMLAKKPGDRFADLSQVRKVLLAALLAEDAP